MIGGIRESKIPPDRQGLKLLMNVRRNPLGYFTTLMRETGAFAWLSLTGKPLLMLNDAAAIQHVLQDNFSGYRKGSFYQILKPLLGNGIFLSEGDIWQKQRRESAPVFGNGAFADMTQQMVKATAAMLQRWEPLVAAGEPIDFHAESMWLALDIFLRALFHQDENGAAANMKSAMGAMLGEAEGRIWSFFHLPQRFVLRLPKYRKALDFLDGIVAQLIARRRINADYPEDLLSRLIKNYDVSETGQKDLRDQVISFLLAGHETTANGLAWTFYQLALHPAVQSRMSQEINHVLDGAAPTDRAIKRLVYTRQVFNEALRLYPPVWTMSREALQDDAIPLEDGGKIAIPRGASIMVCAYAVHRRETYWEHPEAFDPDRFAPDATRGRPKFAWLPFSGGPRLCLGVRFAEMESLVAMAMITQRYRLTLLPGQDIRPMPIITLRPNGPILFAVAERNAAPLSLPNANGAESANGETVAAECPFHSKTA
jgi:cytochrome P450